jgi:hypothetical protein
VNCCNKNQIKGFWAIVHRHASRGLWTVYRVYRETWTQRPEDRRNNPSGHKKTTQSIYEMGDNVRRWWNSALDSSVYNLR